MPNLPAKTSSVNDETRSMVLNPKLDRILDQYLDDLQNGRAGSRDELLAQHPELADELVEYLDGIEMVSGLGGGNDLVPQKVGDFEIIQPIGRGAMGVVYLANQISLKRPVALKVLRYSVTGKQAKARFEREAELVATLQHANIVPIYATSKHDDLHFLAMRLIEGPSLSQWSAAEDADRDPATLTRWAAEVARALAHAHQRDVIHRDVKPSNLLKDEDQKIWLTDFGLARRFDDLRMSMTGAMLGTPNYMSPEQASPSRYPIDHRTDIYSLGATLFELLTGRCVFLAETPHAALAQVLAEEPPLLRELLPDASRDLETILMKCLEKEPSDRYQTADQLADDLEAFADGRLIEARRPSIVEQALRWKRHNQKAVSWALTAATAAVVLLVVSAASWMSWKNSQLGELRIKSEEGPIVGRLIDAKGEPSPIFTIPTEQPMPVKNGRYTLQTWASGKMGVNQDLTINRSDFTDTNVRMFDGTVFPERTVQGVPARLPLGDRNDLVFFHNQGLTRVDGRTGKELWTTPAIDFVKEVNTPATDDHNFVWRFDGVDTYHHNRLPLVTHGFPDINGDGHAEVMIADRTHPSLLAFDGKTGELIWHYYATPTNKKPRRAYSGAIHMPRDIGDVDGDGVTDFATYFRRGKNVVQWLDAVSGKTGKRIWRKPLPKKLVGKSGYILSKSCQITEQGFSPTRQINSSGRYRDGPSHLCSYKTVAAWAPVVTAGENGNEELSLVCGSKLILCDAKTGQSTDFNEGQPLELGFVPAIEPKLILSADGLEHPIGVLLCEIVSIPDSKTTTKPVTRFSMRSLETGEELWRFDSASYLNWTGIKPDWPLLADLTGDAVPEILIADKADLEKDVSAGASCQGSLQALDARTGKPLWNSDDVAKIRCQDRQIQRLLIGPDADADLLDDVYVVSPMSEYDTTGNVVYVDILSAATGKLIRTTRSEVPMFASDSKGVDFEKPFFFGVGADGHPRLVVATMRSRQTDYGRQSTVLISTGTGEVTNVGDGLEYPIHADGDGDAVRDLFLIKPSSRDKIYGAGQLISIKSKGGREQKFASGEYLKLDDVDGDDIRDLLNLKTWQVISGATGERLWQWTYQTKNSTPTKLLDGDIDGDQVRDFLVAESLSNKNVDQALVTLVSGRKGDIVWQKRLSTSARYLNQIWAKCEDMNGDGHNDLVLMHGFNSTGGRLRVACLDGLSGTELWNSDLGDTDLPPELQTEPFFITDVDDDENPDVLIKCIGFRGAEETIALNGRSGEVLWQMPAIVAGKNSQFRYFGQVLLTGENNSKHFVTTTTVDRDSVRVDFHDLSSGKRVSTWKGDGQFKQHFLTSGYPPQLWNGVPFEVNEVNAGNATDAGNAVDAGERCHAGICIQDTKTKKLQLVVLDPSGINATVVQRIDIPKLDNSIGSLATDLFVIADTNEDGRTDVIFHDGSDLVAMDLISNEEINRTPMPASWPKLSTVEFDPSLLLLTTGEGMTKRDGEYNHLKLIDMKTLDVVWDLHCPTEAFFDGLLSGGKPDVSDLYSKLPRVLYRGNSDYVRLVASEDDYMGDDKDVRQRILQVAQMPVSFSSDNFQDPRMVELLPWVNGGRISQRQANKRLQSVTYALLIVVGAVLFPFLFVRKMILNKQWSLKTFLLWPLLFAIPYLVLQLPLDVGTDLRYDDALWAGKMIGACLLILPTLFYVVVWATQLWRGNWIRLSLLSLAPIVTAIFIGGMILLENSQWRLPDSKYDWSNLGSVTLIVNGMYCVGLLLLGIWFATSIFGARKLISRRPRLATS